MNKPIADLPSAEASGQGEGQSLASRRRFLGGLVTGGMGVLGLSIAVADPQGPRELPLHEADFYAPHTLAG
ncbi:MAG: hypothetical protein H7836_13010 [Magnetococcus sp. YQC-3]